jgi:hypothetical protein
MCVAAASSVATVVSMPAVRRLPASRSRNSNGVSATTARGRSASMPRSRFGIRCFGTRRRGTQLTSRPTSRSSTRKWLGKCHWPDDPYRAGRLAGTSADSPLVAGSPYRDGINHTGFTTSNSGSALGSGRKEWIVTTCLPGIAPSPARKVVSSYRPPGCKVPTAGLRSCSRGTPTFGSR